MTAAPPNVTDPGRIVAHRGASGVAPENTLAAFRRAADQGAWECVPEIFREIKDGRRTRFERGSNVDDYQVERVPAPAGSMPTGSPCR